LGSTSCGVGACARTVSNCAGGVAQTCTPGAPSSETCNGIDDNCNGTIDESLGNVSCGVGACFRSLAACVGGVAQSCTPGAPQAEVCNNIDDDCDNSTDETFPQSGMACTTGRAGICAAGTYGCTSGALVCNQTNPARTELCNNNLDDNCNGIIDDPMTCNCN